jgi:branched-chain amino acid transport system substrate-binding protein
MDSLLIGEGRNMKRQLTVLLTVAMVFMLGMPVMAADIGSPILIPPIHIGVYLPMTGAVESYGKSAWEGIKAANAMMPALLGRDIKLVLADTKSDRTEAAKAVDTLIRWDKAVAIIGEAISSDSIAGGRVGERYQIPMITPTATNPLVTEGKRYYFRACFSDPFQGEVAAMLALKTLGAKTAVTIVDITQDYCVGLGNYFVKSFLSRGGKVLYTAYIQSGDKDFRTQLSMVQASKPDIIYAPNYYTEVALLAKQAKDLGINVPIVTGDAAQSDELIKLGGRAVEGMYFTAHFAEAAVTTKLGKDVLVFYKKMYNKDLDGFGAMGADAYFLLFDAMRRANSVEGSKVREALATTKDFEGVTGKISLGDDGNAMKSVVINQVKDGKFVYVMSISP